MLFADDTIIIIYDPEKELFQNFVNAVFDSFNILLKVNKLMIKMDKQMLWNVLLTKEYTFKYKLEKHAVLWSTYI